MVVRFSFVPVSLRGMFSVLDKSLTTRLKPPAAGPAVAASCMSKWVILSLPETEQIPRYGSISLETLMRIPNLQWETITMAISNKNSTTRKIVKKKMLKICKQKKSSV